MAMRKLWPNFRSRGSKGQYVFRGVIASEKLEERYTVRVHYRHRFPPKVFVSRPKIEEDAPHTYSDGSLCLYKPGVIQWSERRLVARSVMPWTVAWLIFYEGWLETGIWFGPEAPHTPGCADK